MPVPPPSTVTSMCMVLNFKLMKFCLYFLYRFSLILKVNRFFLVVFPRGSFRIPKSQLFRAAEMRGFSWYDACCTDKACLGAVALVCNPSTVYGVEGGRWIPGEPWPPCPA